MEICPLFHEDLSNYFFQIAVQLPVTRNKTFSDRYVG